MGTKMKRKAMHGFGVLLILCACFTSMLGVEVAHALDKDIKWVSGDETYTAHLDDDGHLIMPKGTIYNSSKINGNNRICSTRRLLASERAEIKKITIQGTLRISGGNWSGFFSQLNNLVEIEGLENIDTSNMDRLEELFQGCSSLRSVAGIENWDVSKVTHGSNSVDYGFSLLFEGCSSLQSINIVNWTNTLAGDFKGMFRNCSSLREIDMRNLSGSGVPVKALEPSRDNMFDGCTNLEYLNLSTLKDTGNYQRGSKEMFNGCTNLKVLVLGSDMKKLFRADELYPQKFLPNVENNEIYTGKWQSLGTGTLLYPNSDINGVVAYPNGEYVFTSEEFMTSYDGSQAETYVWQPRAIPAGTVSVHYLDENNDPIQDSINLPPGNVGYPYNATTSEYKLPTIHANGKTYVLDEQRLPSNAQGERTAEGVQVKYYYKEELPKFTIKFDPGDHGFLDGQSEFSEILFGTSWKGTISVPNVITDPGYVFTGWHPTLPEENSEITENSTYTAQYSPIDYTVTWDSGEHGTLCGPHIFEDGGYHYGDDIRHPPSVEADPGWAFDTWGKDLNDKVYGDVTITALYRQKEYTITWLSGDHGIFQGGQDKKEQTGFYFGDSHPVAPTVISDPGWKFVGWDYEPPESVTENATFTAMVVPNDTVTTERKTVTRTIHYVDAVSSAPIHEPWIDTATFERTVIKDADTGEVLETGDWSPHSFEFDSVKSPSIANYTEPDQPSISSSGVTQETESWDEWVRYDHDTEIRENGGSFEQHRFLNFCWETDENTTLRYLDYGMLKAHPFKKVDKVTGETIVEYWETEKEDPCMRRDTFVKDALAGLTDDQKETALKGYDTDELLFSLNGSKKCVLDDEALLIHGLDITFGEQPDGMPLDTIVVSPRYTEVNDDPEGTKTVKRTIHYQYEDESEAAEDKVQEEVFTRQVFRDELDGTKVYRDWDKEEAEFDEVESPSIANYTPDKPLVEATSVPRDSDNLDVTVTYKYRQGEVSNTAPFDMEKTVTRTIHYVYEDGSEASKDVTQTLTFTHSGEMNLATGEVVWKDWAPGTAEFEEVVSPEIANYVPDKTKVETREVNGDSGNIEVTVTYKKAKDPKPDPEPEVPAKTPQPVYVQFEDEEGKTIASTIKVEGKLGDTKTVQARVIDGYTLQLGRPNSVSFTISEEEQVYTFVYTKSPTPDVPKPETPVPALTPQPITIHYVDDKGNTVHSSLVIHGEIGDVKKVTAPSIEWYTLVTKGATQTFTVSDKKQSFTFVYKREQLQDTMGDEDETGDDESEEVPKVTTSTKDSSSNGGSRNSLPSTAETSSGRSSNNLPTTGEQGSPWMMVFGTIFTICIAHFTFKRKIKSKS